MPETTPGPLGMAWRPHFASIGIPAGFLLLLFLLSVGLSGCGGTTTTGCLKAIPGPGLVGKDAISLDLFHALSANEQARRRSLGRDLLARSRRAYRPDSRLTLLSRAVGLDPDLAEGWLDMAGILRWIAEDARTEEALTQAARVVQDPGAVEPADLDQPLTTRLAIMRAWFHYDRGEWRKGMRWARMVYDVEPGNTAARVITGLLEARLGNAGRAREIAGNIMRADEFATDPIWIKACLEISRGLDREAFSFLLNLRPTGDHVAECWRDMARTAERLGEWSYAEKWYRESAAALPLGDLGCLGRMVHARLAPGSEASVMPVWLGLEDAYVTGSWSAYTAMALEKFNAAVPGFERDRWAGTVVNAAGICGRLGLDRPWSRRAKGLVFAATGMNDRALDELRHAELELGAALIADPMVEAEMGRLLIMKDNWDEALAHLRKAVSLDANNARAWSDLGLVLVSGGDRRGAEQALTRAIDLDPGLATAWYNRGLLNMRKGDLAGAAADLSEAARLAPDNQDIAHLLQRVEHARKQQR